MFEICPSKIDYVFDTISEPGVAIHPLVIEICQSLANYDTYPRVKGELLSSAKLLLSRVSAPV